ncbi:hypothetical protein FSP39_022554 [Pinctada imbricata]|uniref:TIR domain-containing protein n=1 Tax=Pinctada imbricata TaxID=66713 RepID=A0AA89BL99_PINIB|nr:hypothetical protein FSP39_022554 [Pinctada imbricata]
MANSSRVFILLAVLSLSMAQDQYLCPGIPKCFCKKDNSTMNCSGKKLTSIPAKIPKQVERLWLDHNMIIDLDGSNLCTLPLLRELHLENNKIGVIRTFTFNGSCLPSLRDLYLRNNRISVLEDDAFYNMSSLNRTFLENNYINTVSPQAFSGKTGVTSLYLGQNSLTAIPSLGDVTTLQNLYLDTNKITNATFPSDYSNLVSLSLVSLSVNAIPSLRNETFLAIANSNLRKLVLSRNKITQIASGAFMPLKKIQSLKIGMNTLSASALTIGLTGLKDAPLVSLDITGLALDGSLPSTTFQLLQGTPLKSLIMPNNKINSLPSNGFSYLKNLETLKLSNSKISEISNTSFSGVSKLVNLFLDGNSLTTVPQNLPPSLQQLYLNGNEISTLGDYAFKGLSKLRKLFLGFSQIRTLYETTFSGLTSLQFLHLERNNIDHLPGQVFMSLVSLHSLMLNKNNLVTIQGDKSSAFNSLGSLTYLNMADNQCEHIHLDLFNPLKSLMTLHLENNKLGPLIANDVNGQMFSGLQKLSSLFLQNNMVTYIPDPSFKDLSNLLTMNLTNNGITGWGPYLFAGLSSLQHLDLTKNYISLMNRTSVKDFRSLIDLNLSGNPFACTCDLRWFRDWLNSTSIEITNVQNYKCNSPKEWKGKHLLSFDRTKINCTWFSLPVLIGSVVGGIVFIVIVIIFIYYKRWALRFKLYRLRKSCCRGSHYRDGYKPLHGGVFDYDAYISCSNEDETWVLKNLLPDIDSDVLDDKPFNGKFHLYFDPRDKDVGIAIVDNIEKHMRLSRKVIVVLTNDYISKDRHSTFELQLALEMLKDREIEDIIVVMVGRVAVRRIPKYLKFMIEKRKFLEWEDDENSIRTFKERLQDMLTEKARELADVI